jgi:hypothetical protein
MSDFPFEIFEIELHDLWYTIIQAAKNYDHFNAKQDTLLRQILSAREMGTLTRTVMIGGSNETVIAQTSAGRIWSGLPFLRQDIRDAWKESLDLSIDHRRNLAAFIAKLVSVGTCNDGLAGCALLTFRDALETPRRLTASENGSEVPVADLLPAVAAWLLSASDKLIALSSTAFHEFDPEFAVLGELAHNAQVTPGGFSPARWKFWKGRLELISQGNKAIAEEAQHCLGIMKYSVERTNTVLTEPDDVWK